MKTILTLLTTCISLTLFSSSVDPKLYKGEDSTISPKEIKELKLDNPFSGTEGKKVSRVGLQQSGKWEFHFDKLCYMYIITCRTKSDSDTIEKNVTILTESPSKIHTISLKRGVYLLETPIKGADDSMKRYAEVYSCSTILPSSTFGLTGSLRRPFQTGFEVEKNVLQESFFRKNLSVEIDKECLIYRFYKKETQEFVSLSFLFTNSKKVVGPKVRQ